MASKRLLLPRISVPRIVNQLGEAMTRLLSSGASRLPNFEKESVNERSKTLRLQAGPGARVH